MIVGWEEILKVTVDFQYSDILSGRSELVSEVENIIGESRGSKIVYRTVRERLMHQMCWSTRSKFVNW